MGRGDELDLTPSDADVATAEAATRTMLGRYDEPRAVVPPPGLEDRVQAALARARPDVSPVRRRQPWRRAAGGWAAAVAATLLLALGSWALLASGAAPAQVAGSPASRIQQLTLTLALAARPLMSALAGVGPYLGLAVLAVGAGALLWWWLARGRPRRP